MPIPKFRNYDKEDYVGKDFTYRTRDTHTASPMTQPNTLKPTPYEPMLPEHEDPFLRFHQGRRRAMHKWSRYRTTRQSKTKRDAWKSVQMPTRWHFGTDVRANAVSPEEEERLIREYAEKQVSINVR